MKFRYLSIFVGLLLLLGQAGEAGAQSADLRKRAELINAGTVGIVSGGVTGTYVRFASDLSNALDEGYEHRVLAVLGKGSVRNIEDLLLLRGIDVAIVQSDVLDFYKTSMLIPDIERKIGYITKLYNEEVHLLVRSGLAQAEDLQGRKVNFGSQGSGTFMTASIIFDSLGIQAEATTFPEQVALEKLRRGEIDGMFFVGGKPLNLLAGIAADEGLALLPIDGAKVEGAYMDATLTEESYPNLIASGSAVQTVAVGAVMAAYSWPKEHPRHAKVERFIGRFFDKIDSLKAAPFHPKWREVDLRAQVPGWVRFDAAEAWLANN